MAKEVQIVAFEKGGLRQLGVNEDSREAVLALPLNRIIIKLVRIPKPKGDINEKPNEEVKDLLQAISPFPDDDLTVGIEAVRENEVETIAIAAALPESNADDIGEALDAAKLSVVGVDVLVFGLLRGLGGNFNDLNARKLVIVKESECLSFVIMDGDMPCVIRAVSMDGDLKREVLLSLLEAEDFNGPMALTEILLVDKLKGEVDVEKQQKAEDVLKQFAPVRRIEVGENADLVGIAERAKEPSSINYLPESWRQVLNETRFKHKLMRQVAIAGGIWALVMGVLFGVPLTYGFMTDHQKGLSAQHRKQYQAVKEMKEKTDIVKKYSDHARGALEIMKALSDQLPEGIELSSWDYRREDGVTVNGEAESESLVYDFKDSMAKLNGQSEGQVDGEGDAIFPLVELNGLSASKNGQKFKLECLYNNAVEEE